MKTNKITRAMVQRATWAKARGLNINEYARECNVSRFALRRAILAARKRGDEQ